MSIVDESELLRLALDSMRDLVLIKGPRSRLVWGNRAFLDYYGLSSEELRNIIDSPHADPDDTLQYVHDDALVFGTCDHVNVPAETIADHRGDCRLFHTIKSPIDVDSEVGYSVGVSRRHEDDEILVSAHHLEAKALSKPLRLLTSAFPLALTIIDVRGRVVSVSQVWSELFGSPPDGADAFFAEAYGHLSELGPSVAAALGPGETSTCRVRDKGGSGAKEFEFRVGPWSYDDGSRGGVLILALDVTSEALQKADLKAANARFDLVIQAASVGIWDWIDVFGEEEYWSDRFYELLGYEPGEFPASVSSFVEILHPDDRKRTFALIDNHLHGGEPFNTEYRLRHASGEYKWFHVRGIAARDADGKPTKMVGSIQDIDERVKAEQALRRVNDDLEHFTHVAAHDLREPARRQRMLIDMVLEEHGDSLDPELKHDLDAIRRQSDSMLAMIAGFRSLTGFAGPALQPECVDLQELTEGIVDEMVGDEGDATIVIDLPRAVDAYPSLFGILVRNLTQNALRHGSRPLDLKFSHQLKERKCIISVENAWAGEPARITNRIFQPFVSGDGAGSGLGLSICKRVVDRHRGSIVVDPRPGMFKIDFDLGTT